MAEQQQQAQLAQQSSGSSNVISAGHLVPGNEIASSPQRNYYMWKDPLQQNQQQGKLRFCGNNYQAGPPCLASTLISLASYLRYGNEGTKSGRSSFIRITGWLLLIKEPPTTAAAESKPTITNGKTNPHIFLLVK